MSNDPNKPGGPAKTILGWMPSQTPGAPQPPNGSAYPPAAAPPPAYDQGYPQHPAYAATAYGQPAPVMPQQPAQPQPQFPGQPLAQGFPQQGFPQQGFPQQGYPQPYQQPYQPPQPSYPQPQAAYAPPQPSYQPPAAYTPPAYAPPSAPVAEPASRARPIEGATATIGVSSRLRFIRLTYLHLLGAILAFAGIEYLLFTNELLIQKVSVPILKFAFASRYNWLVFLGAFSAVGFVADYFASHTRTRALHYLGLGLYVIAEALIFLPLLAVAEMQAMEFLAKTGKEAHIVRDAAFFTLAIFGALTASVLITKKDFSFMRSALVMMSAAAMVLIVVSILFGFTLGIVFSIAMVILAAGQVLYYTSQVLAHYDPEDYVAASLALFSSVALMFWYVIRILMKLREWQS
jgi:uncharacterized protein